MNISGLDSINNLSVCATTMSEVASGAMSGIASGGHGLSRGFKRKQEAEKLINIDQVETKHSSAVLISVGHVNCSGSGQFDFVKRGSYTNCLLACLFLRSKGHGDPRPVVVP